MSAFAQKLARLARPHAPAPASPEPWSGSSRLPFDTLDGPHGRLAVREVEVPGALRVGRVVVQDALGADPAVLSALAGPAHAPALGALARGSNFCAQALAAALYLDVETTGLGGGTANRAFLVGMCRFEASARAFVLEQILLRDPDEEAALLARVRQRIDEAALIVSYNGKAFDMPLLRARMVMARVSLPAARPHLDLLQIARRVHRQASFRLTLASVERRVLAFHRGPDIRGEEVAERYRQYLHSGDERWLGEVVTHNRHDVLSMVALLSCYGQAAQRAGALGGGELSNIARALARAGDHARAAAFADLAVERAMGRQAGEALYARALCAKARGDRAAALADLERAYQHRAGPAWLERPEPPHLDQVRLELAKLYEHFARAPSRALAVIAQGTGEPPEAWQRRRERLLRKDRAG